MRLPGSVLQGILARAALVFLRIYLALVFLLSAWVSFRPDAPPLSGGFLGGVPQQDGYPFHQEFFHRVVEPHVQVLEAVVGWSELLVGITLAIGLLTRFSAVMALVLTVNSMLAWGALNDWAYGAIAVALLIGAAGRTLGLDGMLARRWPRSPLW
jgi:uncharacterized membrane protein YphA (DoxX/SURF4 family)